MYDEEDEFSDPILPETRWCLLLAIVLGAYWFTFRIFRESYIYTLAQVLFHVGYVITPPVAILALYLGMKALGKLRGKGVGRRGLALVGTTLAAIELWAWLILTIYRNIPH